MISPDELKEKIEAIEEVEEELSFQIHRLEDHVEPANDEEAAHLRDLHDGYETAKKYLGILRRYQEGRLRRADRRDSPVEGPVVDR